MAIDLINQQRLVTINRRQLAALAQATLEAVAKVADNPRAGAQVTIVFVRDQKIRELNRDYRGKDYPTDVLSFPAGGSENEAAGYAQENYLGDIVISTDTAARQAQDGNLSLEREIQELVIHGILHLCGYDHESDNGEMNRLELKLRRLLLNQD